MSIPKLHFPDDTPFDPVSMNFPNPSDFEQSDEHASEYEEDEKVRKIVLHYTSPWWKKQLNFCKERWSRQAFRRLLIVAVLAVVPLFWGLILSFGTFEPNTSAMLLMLGWVMASVLTYLALAVMLLIGVVLYHIPRWVRDIWNWIWEKED